MSPSLEIQEEEDLEQEYNYISTKRIAYLYSSKPQPHQFTILVRSIPVSSGRSFGDSVESFFTEYHPSTYLSHLVVHRTHRLKGLISKSDTCSSSRKQNQLNHGFRKTSIATWSNKYTAKFQKEPTAGHVFDKGYLRLDAIKLDEESSTSDQNPNGLCADPELREISEKLHKGVQERIDGGSKGSIASSETVLEIFRKSKVGVLHHKIRKEQSCSKQTKASLEKHLATS